MEIKPIRNEADYKSALKEIEELFDAQPGTPQFDRLEVLIVLVEDYEDQEYAIPLPDPIEAIEYHLERLNLSRKDLEPLIGNRSRVWEILNRKRPLTLPMIRRLAKALGIPADVLVQEYELDTQPSQEQSLVVSRSIAGADIQTLMEMISGSPDADLPERLNPRSPITWVVVEHFIVDNAGNPCPVGSSQPVLAPWGISDCFNPNKITHDVRAERILQ